MKKIINISLVAALCAITIGCSSLHFPGVYRLKVTQANYLEQKMIDKLELGMTRPSPRLVQRGGRPSRQDGRAARASAPLRSQQGHCEAVVGAMVQALARPR